MDRAVSATRPASRATTDSERIFSGNVIAVLYILSSLRGLQWLLRQTTNWNGSRNAPRSKFLGHTATSSRYVHTAAILARRALMAHRHRRARPPSPESAPLVAGDGDRITRPANRSDRAVAAARLNGSCRFPKAVPGCRWLTTGTLRQALTGRGKTLECSHSGGRALPTRPVSRTPTLEINGLACDPGFRAWPCKPSRNDSGVFPRLVKALAE